MKQKDEEVHYLAERNESKVINKVAEKAVVIFKDIDAIEEKPSTMH